MIFVSSKLNESARTCHHKYFFRASFGTHSAGYASGGAEENQNPLVEHLYVAWVPRSWQKTEGRGDRPDPRFQRLRRHRLPGSF